MTRIRDTRPKLIAAKIAETSTETGIDSDVWLNATNRGPNNFDARRLFVSKLPSINPDELAKAVGWTLVTVKRLRKAGAPGSGVVEELTELQIKQVDWLIANVPGKHKVEFDDIKAPPALSLQFYAPSPAHHARWEMAGRALHQAKISAAAIKKAFAERGVKLIDADIQQGHALYLPTEDVDLLKVRRKSDEINRKAFSGERDKAAEDELRQLQGEVQPFGASTMAAVADSL